MDKSSNPWHDMGGSLGDLNAANRYVYAGDDPVNAVDPSGKININGRCASALVSSLVTLGGIAWFLGGYIEALVVLSYGFSLLSLGLVLTRQILEALLADATLCVTGW